MSEDKVNPANEVEGLPEGFIPMSSAQLKLKVPEKPGYHRHWFRGTGERIQRAMQAGYKFVDRNDPTARVNNFDLGGDAKESGNTDMGNRVSVIAGGEDDASGQPTRLYLMECPTQYYEASKKILAERNEQVAATIRGGAVGQGQSGETGADAATRYIKKDANLFTPNKPIVRRF